LNCMQISSCSFTRLPVSSYDGRGILMCWSPIHEVLLRAEIIHHLKITS
jgi:hypothetical protein